MEESFHTIVVGGGQAGLAAGYFLAQHGENFLILDGALRSGDAWRGRWDSLRLFTPSQFNGLPGMPFPMPSFYFPTKDEVADYLEGYARQFHLPVRHGAKVTALHQEEGGYHLNVNGSTFRARNVIIATGPYQQAYTPPFSGELDPGINQLHSSTYCNPKQIPGERVLVVGAGNSGAEISLELTKAGKQVWLAGRDVGSIPADTLGKAFGGRPYWWFISRLMSVNTPMGRKMRGNILYHGGPLIRTQRKMLANAGVECVGRVSGVSDGKPRLEDGRVLEVGAVVWATGFRPDFKWIELPVFDDYGYPRHERGVIPEAPGLYFVGLPFQTALSSALLGGVGVDAANVVGKIASERMTG